MASERRDDDLSGADSSPTNQHKDIVKTFERKSDAERWLTATAAAVHRGDFIEPRRGETLFRAVVDESKETWADLAPKTQYALRSSRYIAENPCSAVRLARKGDGRNITIRTLTHGEVRMPVNVLAGAEAGVDIEHDRQSPVLGEMWRSVAETWTHSAARSASTKR